MFTHGIHAGEAEENLWRNGIAPADLCSAAGRYDGEAAFVGEAENFGDLAGAARRNANGIAGKLSVRWADNRGEPCERFFLRDVGDGSHQKISATPAVSSGCGV